MKTIAGNAISVIPMEFDSTADQLNALASEVFSELAYAGMVKLKIRLKASAIVAM